MNVQDKRLQRALLLDERIAEALRASEASGELKAAPSYGKPMSFGDGYDETPAELRMPFKILKDAGYAPPEITLMREIAALRTSLADAGDDDAARQQRRRLVEMQQQLALRLEKLRSSGTL